MEAAAIRLRKTVKSQEGESLALEYRLLESEILVEDEWVTTYGISITDVEEKGCAVYDISADRGAVLGLLELMWRKDVTPLSLEDIVQDYIEN